MFLLLPSTSAIAPAVYIASYTQWRELSQTFKLGYVMAMWDQASLVASDDSWSQAQYFGLTTDRTRRAEMILCSVVNALLSVATQCGRRESQYANVLTLRQL